MFAVSPSLAVPTEDGLFAATPIQPGIVGKIPISRVRTRPSIRRDHECLDFFVPHDVDPDTLCVHDGQLVSFRTIRFDQSVHDERYVTVTKTHYSMKANDLAYSPTVSLHEYLLLIKRNKLELVLEVARTEVIGVYLVAIDEIAVDEEVGISYGPNFWDLYASTKT